MIEISMTLHFMLISCVNTYFITVIRIINMYYMSFIHVTKYKMYDL